MYKYIYRFFCLYWFLKSIVCACVSQRWFVCMDNQLIELLAVCCQPQVQVFWNDQLQQRWHMVSFFSKLVVKEMSRVGGKHLCAHSFKDNTLDLQVSVLFIWYTCTCTHNMSVENWFSYLTTLITAVDGNTNPPLCLKAVNLAHKGPMDSCEAWASVRLSSSSPLHVSQETFARSDQTMYPAM